MKVRDSAEEIGPFLLIQMFYDSIKTLRNKTITFYSFFLLVFHPLFLYSQQEIDHHAHPAT